MQHVGEEQRERLVADDLAGAPNGVAKPQGLLLAREARLPGAGQLVLEQVELLALAALVQGRLELELLVEMILDHPLVAAGDEDEVLDAGIARLVDGMLDDRPV